MKHTATLSEGTDLYPLKVHCSCGSEGLFTKKERAEEYAKWHFGVHSKERDFDSEMIGFYADPAPEPERSEKETEEENV